MGHTELANSTGTPARFASATTGAKVEDRLAFSNNRTLSCVSSFLALAVALPGSAEIVLQDEVDLLAGDAAGGVDAIDVDAERLRRRGIG